MFKTKQIKTGKLGEILKNTRESLKITLGQASKNTGIPVNYLQNLEEGNYKGLPADIYIVAYLKKYTKILNLDIGEILEQFKMERGIQTSFLKSQELIKGPFRFITKHPLVVTPKRMSLVLGILVIALIFGYFWHQLSYIINPPIIKLSQPVSDFTTSETSVEVFGQTESDVYLTINGQEVYVDKVGHFQSIVSLDTGLNILKIEAKDRFGKTNAIVRRIIVTK